jgi:predicted transcriptional regulator
MVHTKKPHSKVIDVADKDFVSLDENTSVAEAASIMYERDINNSVVVTHNDSETLVRHSVGITTVRDFLNRESL